MSRRVVVELRDVDRDYRIHFTTRKLWWKRLLDWLLHGGR